MKLGEKILELRKKNWFSQEQLGEKINVTRQTISNWELGETSPNPEQLKLLSKVLNVSIDELLDNDIQSVLVEKVSNTEKLAGLVLKVLKWLGIIFIIFLVIDVVALILFSSSGNFVEYHGASTICKAVGDNSSIMFIQDIIVLPEFQRQGIGSGLLTQTLDYFKDVYQIHLLTDNSEKTVKFYESVGMKNLAEFDCVAFTKL